MINLHFTNQIQTQFDIRLKITYEKTNIYISWAILFSFTTAAQDYTA